MNLGGIGLVGQKHHSGEKYLQAFCIGAVLTLVFFLPFVIAGKGLFVYYGDYNVQQIPFYQLAHEAVRSGNMGWSWLTDLGANFVGSYSFYLLGSPFFWLTIPFPNWLVPYLMVPLFALKFGVASLTGYAYIRRFTKTPDFALIGGLLYAFSGYMIYNIFFNHFHDVVAFFPLLLIALEEYMVNNRKGVFALTVGLMAVINYYFFVGEVVFLFIYFFVRSSRPECQMSIQKFLWLAVESILGVLLAAVLLVPSAIVIMDNPRVDNMIMGWNMVFYGNEQRYGLILQSLFFPPDMPARPVFFPDSNAKWSSVAAFLPLFGMAGVITFIREKKGHWLRSLLLTCLVFAMIPILNASFSAFNHSYYARWFFMPILMMALATVLSFENQKSDLLGGAKTCIWIICAFAVIGVLPAMKDGKMQFGALPSEGYLPYFWLSVAIALGCMLALSMIVKKYRSDPKRFRQVLLRSVCTVSVVYSICCLTFGKVATSSENYENVTRLGLDNRAAESDEIVFDLDQSDFFRVDVYDGMDNWPMFWRLPTIQAFHSIVPGSVMEFYPEIGVERSVGSRPDVKFAGLRGLTSVRYLFAKEGKEKEDLIPGFSYYDTQNGFVIYENENFIPMGFTYDSYINREDFDAYNKEKRDRLLLKAILLDDEQIEKYGHLFTHLTIDDGMADSTDEAYAADCQARAAKTAENFQIDTQGFTATTNFDEEDLVFFSVPYDRGWTAYVNGQEAEIEKVNVGFMAVHVPAGSAHIRFIYKTPGLLYGLLISGVGFLAWIAYVFWMRYLAKKNPAEYAMHYRAHRIYEENGSPAESAIVPEEEETWLFSDQMIEEDTEQTGLPLPSQDAEPTEKQESNEQKKEKSQE